MAKVGFDAATTTSGAGAPTKFEKAYLQLYEPSRDGSLAKPGGPLGRVEFQFNPRELTVGKSASWARATGTGNTRSGPPQYNGPLPSKLNLEMFLDASDTQNDSVVKTVELLLGCCVPTSASHAQNRDSPPWVVFRWGGVTGFLAYISSVSAKYSLFTSSGVPIRAVVTVVLEELAGDPPGQNPTSGGLVPRRIHVMSEGDTLPGLAYREYGKAEMWRDLALANDIDDPFRIRLGSTLLLPAAEELMTQRRSARATTPSPEVHHAAR
ncbi:peptidase M23 [Georgenia sp. MJ170]|uniref:CIS tube protein n=1 Tax=Georgenia sunbinii TaxID=3117728 RepID=UPI002F2645D9